MLVKDRMSHPVIMIRPDMPIMEALDLMKREGIRRTPVVHNNKMVGIVSMSDLLNASPSSATSLSVWEINYLVSKIKVKDLMTKEVKTVDENATIEEAAWVMVDYQVGGLPVMREGHIVGIITQSDLFKIFLEMMGAREPGVRVTALVPNQRGVLAGLAKAIADLGGSFVSMGIAAGENETNRTATFKVDGVTREQVETAVKPHIVRLLDIR